MYQYASTYTVVSPALARVRVIALQKVLHADTVMLSLATAVDRSPCWA